MKSSAIIKTQKSNKNQLKSTLYLICQNSKSKIYQRIQSSITKYNKKILLRECIGLNKIDSYWDIFLGRPGHFTRTRRTEPEPTRKYKFGFGSESMLSTYWVFFLDLRVSVRVRVLPETRSSTRSTRK